MSLKRNGAYRHAWLIALPALLFLGYEGVVIAHLASTGDWSVLVDSAVFGLVSLFFLSVVGVIGNLFAILAPITAFWYAHALSGIRANVEGNAPLATFQPDRSVALHDGETLTLSLRRRRGKGENIFGSVIVLLLLLLSGEALVVPLLPAASTYLQNLVSALTSGTSLPAPNLSLLDWLAVAFPILCALACIPFIVNSDVGGGAYQIIADDHGATRRRAWGRAQFIPWSDVALFLRRTDSPIATAEGNYLLWGRHHLLEFNILRKAFGARTTPPANGKRSTRQTGGFIFDGGYEHYYADAHRLLATICARSGAPPPRSSLRQAEV